MQPSLGKPQVRHVLQFCSDSLRLVSILSLIAATLSKSVPRRPGSGKESRDVATVTQVVWDLFEDIPHLLRGMQSGILFHEQVYRADSAR